MVKPVEDKDDRKPQKPPTKAEGNLAKTIILQDIVGLQKIEFFFPFNGYYGY